MRVATIDKIAAWRNCLQKNQHRTRAGRHELLYLRSRSNDRERDAEQALPTRRFMKKQNARDRPFAGLTQFFELGSFVPC